jgi:hypothetical protein
MKAIEIFGVVLIVAGAIGVLCTASPNAPIGARLWYIGLIVGSFGYVVYRFSVRKRDGER